MQVLCMMKVFSHDGGFVIEGFVAIYYTGFTTTGYAYALPTHSAILYLRVYAVCNNIPAA